MPFSHRPVYILNGPRLEQPSELRGGLAVLRDHKDAARVPVETVNEARALAAEAVCHPGQEPVDVPRRFCAALHGDAERLVQDHDLVILEDDHALDEIAVGLGEAGRRLQRRRNVRRGGREMNRDAHLLPRAKPGLGLHAPAVDAHLPRAHQLCTSAWGGEG